MIKDSFSKTAIAFIFTAALFSGCNEQEVKQSTEKAEEWNKEKITPEIAKDMILKIPPEADSTSKEKYRRK